MVPSQYFYALLHILILFSFHFRVIEDQGSEELMSVYETLYPPSSDPPPPPLPPRAFPPCTSGVVRNPKHRPLERTRALPYQGGSFAMNPPEVLRQHKPGSVLSSTNEGKKECKSGKGRYRHMQNQQGPSLPPKPRKLLNPEDSFAFEIIDTDELRPVQTMNMAVMRFSSQSPQKPQAASCTKLKGTGRCETHELNLDNAISKNNNNEVLPQALTYSSLKSRSGLKNSAAGVEADVPCNSDEMKGTSGAKSVSNNYCKRPVKLGVKDTSCNGSSNMEASEGFPVVSAPLATPEQDSSLVDSSSVENLLAEGGDVVFSTPDNEGAEGETYTCPVQENSSSVQQDIIPSGSAATTVESSKHQSCTHLWPVNDLQVICDGKQNSENKSDVSSSHQTDQDGSSEVNTGGVITGASSFASVSSDSVCKICVSGSDIPVTMKPSKLPLQAPHLESASAVSFQDLVCEVPVILTDMPNRENQTVNSASVLSDSEVSNTDTSSLLSVPNPSSSLSISPVSTNSSSESGLALSTAAECSTSSGSDSNTMTLINYSSSTDSLGASVPVMANVDITSSESGERESRNFNDNLSSELRDEAISSCIAVGSKNEENAGEESAEFVDASADVLVPSNSPTLRTHKPLSRQVSHPPMTSLGDRPEPSASHFCTAARLLVQHQIADETLATTPRPHNR